MSHALDFSKIREHPIADVAAKLGLKLEVKGDQLTGPCPISKSGNATAFKITPARNRFVCFCAACKQQERQGGDVIEMVRRIRGCAIRDAAQAIEDLYTAKGADEPAETPTAPQEVPQPSQSAGFDPLDYQRKLQPDHPALVPLGITADTIRAFGGGFASKGLLMGRLALPIYQEGKIVAFFGIGLPVPHDLKLSKNCPDVFAPTKLGEEVQLLDHPLKVMKAYEDGQEDVLCALKPLTWEVLTSLAEHAKENGYTLVF